jgi:hypothetical protein
MELSREQRQASDALARRVAELGLSGALAVPPEEPSETSLTDHIKRTTAAAVLSSAAMSLAITESASANADTSAVISYEPVSYNRTNDIFPITDTSTSTEITIPSDTPTSAPKKDPFIVEHDDPSAGLTITIPPSVPHSAEEELSPSKSLKPKTPKKPTVTNKDSNETKEERPRHRTTKGEVVPDKVNGMVYKNQGDLRWSSKTFNPAGITGRTIAGSGCGPTSLSIVIGNLAGEKVTPYGIGQEIIKEGLRVDGGTAHAALQKIPKEHGLNARFIPPTASAIDKAFKIDKRTMIIVNGRDDDPNTPASKGGHIYVLSGMKKGGYNVLDPASYWKTLKTHPKRTITGPATVAVAITIPDNMVDTIKPKAKPKRESKPVVPPEQTDVEPADDTVIPSSAENTGQFDDVGAVQASQIIEISPEDSEPTTVSDITIDPSVGSPVETPVEPPAEEAVKPSPPPKSEAQPKEKAAAPEKHATKEQEERALQAMIEMGGNWKNRGIAMRYLMRENLSAAQAAGVVGNFMIESDDGTGPDVNPRGKQLEGGPGRGIAQWTAKTPRHAGGRWDTDPVNVLSFAAKRNLDPWDLKTQLAFIVYEGRDSDTMWNRTWPALKAADKPREAAIAFEEAYEAASAPAHGPRGDAAVLVYQEYKKLLASQSA